MPREDRDVDLERLLEVYEPLSHEEMVRWLRHRRFADPKWLYMEIKDPSPWQGDVIPAAELHFTTREGTAYRIVGPAILLSHGCDAVPEQDPVAVMAPVFEVAEFAANDPNRDSLQQNLKANRFPGMFFLPAVGNLPDRYANFNYAAAVSTGRIHHLFASSDPAERTRFSKRGWWFFTAKLAHNLARQEDPADYPRPFY